MGRIYRNLKEIPIPAEGRLNHYDKKVSVYRKVNGQRRRTVIGAATSETTMIPNENFRIKFPELWREYYGPDLAPLHQLRVGLYGLCLSIGWSTGLYVDLQETIGPQYANAAMDFAMYSIRERSSTAQLFRDEMQHQMLFSRKALSDSWYSEFFGRKLGADRIHAFKAAWLKRCTAQGKTSVWLCIDGSNNDCAVRGSALAGLGHAKSHRQTEIVSYMWAVDAHSGRPVTWFVNNGALHDSKAVDEVIRFLAASDINVEGVILDRGFVSQDVFDLLESKGIEYIVMLKSNNAGYREMMKRHAADIRWKMKRFVRSGIFGTTDRVKLFNSSCRENCTGLYFVGMNGASKTVKLMERVIDAAEDLKQAIARNPETASIPADMKKYLVLLCEGDKPVGVDFNFEAWQTDADELGYHAIASSSDRTACEIHELYRLRDVSEKQFCQLKSQLDGSATRVHSDAAIEARFAVAFIASILRTEICLACEEHKLDTNEMLRQADSSYLLRMPNGLYEEIHSVPRKCLTLFKAFGLSVEHFSKFADEVNDLGEAPEYAQVRKLPDFAPRRRGRPKGSKNKATLEREARDAANGISVEPVPKRKPGRPKGSKNKSTLEREAAEAAQPTAPEVSKRKPGRPKGSKNKKTLECEALAAARREKRGPGRPKGRKNNATLEREAREAQERQAAQKRGPGRPKGSKNRPKSESDG